MLSHSGWNLTYVLGGRACFHVGISSSGFPGGSDGRVCHLTLADLGSGRSPGEGNSKPLQYSCLGNPMDEGS